PAPTGRGAAVDAAASARPAGRAARAPASPAPAATPAAASERLVETALGERWAGVVAGLIERGSIGALVRELAWQAQCIAVVEPVEPGTAAVWRLRVERETLRAPAHVERLQAALAEALERPVRVETESGSATDTPALRAAAERERRQRDAEAAIAGDPLVCSLLSQFKTARIVPGSIQPC
ncbi:MAG: DNA polymerase III subunit gamma/tau, partial [Ideonella sp.]|nr:DNA polymerase III subunit gamma/tau [Ideonella sp.]